MFSFIFDLYNEVKKSDQQCGTTEKKSFSFVYRCEIHEGNPTKYKLIERFLLQLFELLNSQEGVILYINILFRGNFFSDYF